MTQDQKTKVEIKKDLSLVINNVKYISDRIESCNAQRITSYLETAKSQIESALKTAYQELRE
jgi:hypothetical protein